jgi:hypothetical protein
VDLRERGGEGRLDPVEPRGRDGEPATHRSVPAELPRRHRLRIAPETAPLCPSRLLGASIGHPVLRGLLALIALVMPSHAGLDLIEAGIRPVHEHLAEDAPVPVPLVEDDRDRLVVCQIREVLLRYLPATLALGNRQAGATAAGHAGHFVRREIAESLRRPGVGVFPLLVNGAEMPDEEELPEPLKALHRRQAFELTVRHWPQDVAQLVQTLKRVPGFSDDRRADEDFTRPEAEQAAQRRKAEERAANEEAERIAAEEDARRQAAEEEAQRRASFAAFHTSRRTDNQTPNKANQTLWDELVDRHPLVAIIVGLILILLVLFTYPFKEILSMF